MGDYDLQSVATLKDQWGFCSGTNCQGPSVGGIGGAGDVHISSVKILIKTTSGCTTGMQITASSSTGTGFYAVITATSGQIDSIQVISHGYGYTTAPYLIISDPACTCDSLTWENASTAVNSGACLQAIVGRFADSTACVPEPGQRYLIARDYKYQVAFFILLCFAMNLDYRTYGLVDTIMEQITSVAEHFKKGQRLADLLFAYVELISFPMTCTLMEWQVLQTFS